MSFSPIILIAAIIIFVSVIFTIYTLNRKRGAVIDAKELILPGRMPPEGIDVPVLESFAGFKYLGPIAFWQNKICPVLVLYEDSFEYRVFRTKIAKYNDIEIVRSFRSKYYNRMRFEFAHTNITFTVVFTDGEIMARVLGFLEEKGIIPEAGDKI